MAKRQRIITVAFQAVETTPMRQFRCVQTGVWDRRRMPTMRTRHDELDESPIGGEGFYWCAADRPETEDTASGLWVRRITLKTVVHPHARCEECGIPIRELQASMGELFS